MNPGRSDQATSDEGQVIIESLGNFSHTTQTDHDFQIPICNIDDILSRGSPCSDTNTHTNSLYKTSSNDPVSCLAAGYRVISQHTINLSEKASLQVPVKLNPLGFSILDAENEKGLVLPVETTHANQQKDVFSGSHMESSDTGFKSVYTLGDSHSHSTTDNSAMVNKIADGGSLYELFSDEKEVEFCSYQPANESSQNANLEKTFSDVLLTKKENSFLTTHCSLHSELLGVFSTDKASQTSNGTKSVSSTVCHNNSAIDTFGKACAAFSAGSLKIRSSPSPPGTNSVTQGSTANLHAGALLTSDSLKHLNTNISTSMIKKEKVLECRTYLNPNHSSLLKKTPELNNSDHHVLNNIFKLQADTQSRPNTSASKLKGLSIKSKNKPQNETIQFSAKSESPVSTNASFNRSKKDSFLKTNIQLNTNRCLELPNASDLMQVTAEHGPSGGALQIAQLAKEKDIPFGSKATAKSLERLHRPASQKTSVEVVLSCLSGSSSPLMSPNEPVNSKDSKSTQRGADAVLAPMISTSTVKKLNVMVSNSLFSSLCSTKETHSATSYSLKPRTIVEKSENLKSSISRLYTKTLERRSFSTDTALSSNYNRFSVRHKIKSFENLANFDKPVIKNIDIQSYPLARRTSLNQRLAGYLGLVNSTDCEARQSSLSFYAENLIPTTHCSHSLCKSPSSIALINLELPHSSCSTASLTEDNTEWDVQKVPDGITSQISQVLRKKHRKFPCIKLRQLRALSMPELEKLCKEDYTKEHGAVIDKTEPGLHPTIPKKDTDTWSFPPSTTMKKVDVNRASQGKPGSTEAAAETHGHQPGWSIR